MQASPELATEFAVTAARGPGLSTGLDPRPGSGMVAGDAMALDCPRAGSNVRLLSFLAHSHRNDMYKENDKIMVLATGEVFTVAADFTEHLEYGIVVKENLGRNLRTADVRAAGHTRQRADAGRGIVAPEPLPPPPDAEDLL